jgi:hypothetical protein
VKFARTGWAAAAVVLLAAVGCDYWDNLVDGKTYSRADLEVEVVDAWTGKPLADAPCRDSVQAVSGTADDQGVFRIVAGATGQYAITCSHEWYYDGSVSVHLTKAGAHTVARLARRGESENWYPEGELQVRIASPIDSLMRFPATLDWQATPWDTRRNFRYEWSFKVAKSLSHGHLNSTEQLDSESFSPHFRAQATTEKGIHEGADTVILTVYSLLKGGQAGYPVGSAVFPFQWVHNKKPYARFDASERTRYPRAGCKLPSGLFESVHFVAGDSDGRCDTVRFWTKTAPTLRMKDTLLTCSDDNLYRPKVEILPPGPNAEGISNGDGSFDYLNVLSMEITDDNGEKAQDTITLRTHTNVPPTGSIFYPIQRQTSTYIAGDPIAFKVEGHDTDGYIQRMDLLWSRNGERASAGDPRFPPNRSATDTNQWIEYFTTPGTYAPEAWIFDDCPDSTHVSGQGFTVVKNTPPSIMIGKINTNPTASGDSLEVSFDLRVTDVDAEKGHGDSLTVVKVTWGSVPVEMASAPLTPYSKTVGPHTFPMPSPGSSLSIRIHAVDAHSGPADDTIEVKP